MWLKQKKMQMSRSKVEGDRNVSFESLISSFTYLLEKIKINAVIQSERQKMQSVRKEN